MILNKVSALSIRSNLYYNVVVVLSITFALLTLLLTVVSTSYIMTSVLPLHDID